MATADAKPHYGSSDSIPYGVGAAKFLFFLVPHATQEWLDRMEDYSARRRRLLRTTARLLVAVAAADRDGGSQTPKSGSSAPLAAAANGKS